MRKSFFMFLIVFSFFIAGCSIDTSVKPDMEGFVLGDGDVGIVLTHGLGASPYEVRGLAEYLAQRNITVYVVRLAGHGTSVQDLAAKKWEDWYESYRNAYLSMKPIKRKIFIGGMSTGGLIALKLAEDENENIAGVVSLAPALLMQDWRAKYAWILKYFVWYNKRYVENGVKQYYYDRHSVASVAQAVELEKIVRNNLGKISVPIFLMQYSNDTTVSPESSRIVYDEVSSKEKQLIWVNGTGHVFLDNADKNKYFEQIYQFINDNS